jgi:hypothetical protein
VLHQRLTRRQRVRLRKARNRIARDYGQTYGEDQRPHESREILRGLTYWSVIAMDRMTRGATEARIRYAYARASREEI